MKKSKIVKEFVKRVDEVEGVKRVSLNAVVKSMEEWRDEIFCKYVELEEKERRGEELEGQEVINASYYYGILEGLDVSMKWLEVVGRKGRKVRKK